MTESDGQFGGETVRDEFPHATQIASFSLVLVLGLAQVSIALFSDQAFAYLSQWFTDEQAIMIVITIPLVWLLPLLGAVASFEDSPEGEQ